MSDKAAYFSALPLRSTSLLSLILSSLGWKMFCSSIAFILFLNQFICTLPIRRAGRQC